MHMSVPNRLAALHQHLRQSLWSAGVDTADIDARLIVRYHTGYDLGDIISNPDQKIDASKMARIAFDTERRLSGEPVSRIFGRREFWGLDFKISPETLDPRPDTETIVEVATDRLGKTGARHILDLGAGSGCILIALLSEWEQAWGVGVDLSCGAIKAARINARYNKVLERSSFVCGSWAESLSGTFDLIVSNPPYIPESVIESLAVEVRKFDPILALSGGVDGLSAFRSVIRDIPRLLTHDGFALLEIGYDQESEVARLVEDSGLFLRDVHLDLAGTPRVLEICHGDKSKKM